MLSLLMQSVTMHPHAKPLTALAIYPGLETLFPLVALQSYVLEQHPAELLATCSTWLVLACLTYVVILSVFRLLFFENDSLLHSLLQILFCSFLALVRWCSYALSGPLIICVQLFTSVLALYFVHCLHTCYVSGRRYKPTSVEGRVFIITGSNAGIGFETAKHIVSMGGMVVLACRSVEKAQAAREQIIKLTKCKKGKVLVLHLDLCCLKSVKAFVAEFIALKLPLHALINNAGVMMSSRQVTEAGMEKVFAVNYLAHFYLTNLLLPELEKTSGRIVNVASTMHKLLKQFDFDDIMAEKSFSLFGTYAQSKLAMILFAKELQRRMDLKGSKVTCNAVHPGCVYTDITRDLHVIIRVANDICYPTTVPLRKNALEGAYTSIHLATSDEVKGKGGGYYFHCQAIPSGPCANDGKAGERLWALSEEMTGLQPSEKL